MVALCFEEKGESLSYILIHAFEAQHFFLVCAWNFFTWEQNSLWLGADVKQTWMGTE